MYKHHSIALNQKDQAIYEKVNKATGLAVTAIFRKMLYSLEKVVDTPQTRRNSQYQQSKLIMLLRRRSDYTKLQ